MQVDWLEILSKVFEVAILPVLGAATVYLVALINAKKAELVSKTNSELTKKYIEMLDKTITDCVLATNQTYVDALKKQGSFDIDAQKKAFEITYNAVMSIISDDVEMYLAEAVKDLNAYITNKIEAQVIISKQPV